MESDADVILIAFLLTHSIEQEKELIAETHYERMVFTGDVRFTFLCSPSHVQAVTISCLIVLSSRVLVISLYVYIQ